MNKAFLLLAVLAAVPACTKKNDVATLRHEAVSLSKYYTPRIDSLQGRVDAIFKRGSTIPANLPGIDAVGARLTEARDLLVQMRGHVAPGPDQKSSVEKQADAAAKDGKVHDLEKLIHDTHAMLDRGMTVVNDNLSSVESWIAQYDAKTLATTIQVGANPPGTSPSATGQPPPASGEAPAAEGGAGGGSAAGAGAAGAAGAPAPTAEPARPARPAQPARPGAGSAAQPSRPGAGSAAQPARPAAGSAAAGSGAR